MNLTETRPTLCNLDNIQTIFAQIFILYINKEKNIHWKLCIICERKNVAFLQKNDCKKDKEIFKMQQDTGNKIT